MTGTTIQPLVASDRRAWDPLWQGYLDFYGTQLPTEVTDETWRRLLDPGSGIYGLGAKSATGDLIGFVHFLYHPVTWSIASRCYLEDLFVAGEARGSGAGRALIEAVYAHADARDADQVYWLTQDFNDVARRLYDRVGRKSDFIKYQR
jgi:GNAT superfamily N-acetyltransferase